MNKPLPAKIVSIVQLTDNIIQLIVQPEIYRDYQAGQYLQIRSAAEWVSYSIANAPLSTHTYELHVRYEPKTSSNPSLIAGLKQEEMITINLPFGECHINRLKAEMPIIFIAGGTGLAPVKAMIEQLTANGDPRPVELYWGARTLNDLYMDNRYKEWQSCTRNFHYFSLLPTKNSEDTLASRVIFNHLHDLTAWQIVISGPFDMVYNIRDNLVDAGVDRLHLHSDAFAFEKKRNN